MGIELKRIEGFEDLWMVGGETNGYVIVRNGKSLMIDCPAKNFAGLFEKNGIPSPELILHTQVQEEHCREWAAFPGAGVRVYKKSEPVALLSGEFLAAYDTVWDMDADWTVDRGMERFGLGSCVTERPPKKALNVTEAFDDGETLEWNGEVFKFLALPGSGKYACAIHWIGENAVFSGDAVNKGGWLANMYDLERCYGHPYGYAELAESLRKLTGLEPKALLPSSGPIICEPASDCAALAERIKWTQSPPSYRTGEEQSFVNYAPARQFGRYKEVVPGVYQNNNAGNMILFVNENGGGLLVDPDNCVWESWDENVRAFHGDLDLLEKETGLKKIDMAVLTHIHGDHVRFTDIVRERYGAVIAAAPDVAAAVSEPRKFPYPCRIPWYGLPFDHIKIDRILKYDECFDWSGVSVKTIRTPGHSYAHTGFVIKWGGYTAVCTGDTLQYGSGPICCSLPVLYSDTAWPDRGFTVTYKNILEHGADLILGGHSFSFFDPKHETVTLLDRAAKESMELAKKMLVDGDLMKAMTPPGYDDIRVE